LRNTTTKSATEKRTIKEQIRQIIKRPKEKFLTPAQEEYWEVLENNQITFCFGPAGTGKSHIAMKKAVDLLWNEDNKYEKY
jgi:phosphate starvation-inducible protein PhoH